MPIIIHYQNIFCQVVLFKGYLGIDVFEEADGPVGIGHHRRVQDVDRNVVLETNGLVIGALEEFLDALHGPVAIIL